MSYWNRVLYKDSSLKCFCLNCWKVQKVNWKLFLEAIVSNFFIFRNHRAIYSRRTSQGGTDGENDGQTDSLEIQREIRREILEFLELPHQNHAKNSQIFFLIVHTDEFSKLENFWDSTWHPLYMNFREFPCEKAWKPKAGLGKAIAWKNKCVRPCKMNKNWNIK